MATDGKGPIQAAPENRPAERLTDLPKQILSSSGTMIGLCTTIVGLIKIVEGRIGPSNVDIYIALLGSMFLGSAVFSYASIRMATLHSWSARLEIVAGHALHFRFDRDHRANIVVCAGADLSSVLTPSPDTAHGSCPT